MMGGRVVRVKACPPPRGMARACEGADEVEYLYRFEILFTVLFLYCYSFFVTRFLFLDFSCFLF